MHVNLRSRLLDRRWTVPQTCAAIDPDTGALLTRHDKPLADFCWCCLNGPRKSVSCLWVNGREARREARRREYSTSSARGLRKGRMCNWPRCIRWIGKDAVLCETHHAKVMHYKNRNKLDDYEQARREAMEFALRRS